MANYHPLARELESLWQGMQDNPETNATFLNEFAMRLGVKHDELQSEHSNNGRFGMSKAGGCTRAAALKLLGHEPEPFTGSTKFTFWLGHMCEVAAVASLVTLGYPVDGTQSAVAIDPMMHSYSDGIVTYKGATSILSVKSAAYKMSGKRGKVFTRRGFAELPFGGAKKVQPNWWAQAQAEMHGSDVKNVLLVVVSKDIVKAFEGDEFLGPTGNGSLTFYCEELPYDKDWCEKHLVPAWEASWRAVQRGTAGPALVLNNESLRYMPLQRASTEVFPNKNATGTYNSCNYCDYIKTCAEVA